MLVFTLLLLLLAINGAPIVVQWCCRGTAAAPVDLGLKAWDDRPLLGKAKTWRGLIAALLVGTGVALALGQTWHFGLLFAALSMLGDLGSSFVKRRLALAPSAQALVLDQLPESLLPALYAAWQLNLSIGQVSALVAGFFALELLVSRPLYHWGVRNRPY